MTSPDILPCPRCQKSLRPDARRCPGCGLALKKLTIELAMFGRPLVVERFMPEVETEDPTPFR